MTMSLPVVNLSTATYECIFGRGCDGICCQNGRPGIYPEEEKRITKYLHKFLPELRPDARKLIEKEGYISNRRRGGLPMLRVTKGWCVFFNQGCVLHKVGAVEGDKYRYKPAACALFPLARNAKGDWYVRQHGVENEEWDVFCLNPASSPLPASESLGEEMALAARYMAEDAAAEKKALKAKNRSRDKQPDELAEERNGPITASAT
jgi:Fe-S-cluster containining protein